MVSKRRSFPKYIDSDYKCDLNKKLYCYICNIEDNWDKHRKEKEHLLRSDYFRKNFTDGSNLVKCKICSKNVYKGHVDTHAIQHQLIPWHRPTDEFIKYFKNFITIFNDSYWCYLCEKVFKYWFSAISHIEDPEHQDYMTDEVDENEINITLPLKFYKECIIHGIFPISVNVVECVICDCTVPGYQNVQEHISGKKHCNLLSASKPSSNDSLSETKEKFASKSGRPQDEFIQYFKNFIGMFENCYWCYLCDEEFKNWHEAMSHIENANHQFLLIKKINNKNINTGLSLQFYENCVQHGIFPLSSSDVECLICDCTLSAYLNASEHSVSKRHNKLRAAFKSQNGNLSSEIKEKFTSKSARPKDEFFQYFKNFIGLFGNCYWCYLCGEEFKNWHEAMSHFENTKHQFLLIKKINNKNINTGLSLQFYENCVQHGIFPLSSNNLECLICDCTLSTYLDANEHSVGKKHNRLRSDLTFLHNVPLRIIKEDSTSNSTNTVINGHCKTSDKYEGKTLNYHAVKMKNLTSEILNSVTKISDENKIQEYNSNNHNVSDNDDSEEVPESWESIVASEALNNGIFQDSEINSMKGIYENNKVEDGWTLVDSSFKRVNKKKYSGSKTTDLQFKSAKKSKKKKSSKRGAKKAKETKQKRGRSSNQPSRLITNSISLIVCRICKNTFKSHVLLHVHLTSHFWPRFVQENEDNKIVSNTPAQNGSSDNNENSEDGIDEKVIANVPSTSTQMNPTFPQIKSSHFLHARIQVLPNSKKFDQDKNKTGENSTPKPSKSYKNNNPQGTGQLVPDDRFCDEKYLIKFADIEPDKPRDIDIYEIDSVQLKMMNLSATRCCILDKENIYCLICRQKVTYSLVSIFEHFRDIKHNDYLLEMIQDHIKFMYFSEQFSDLSLAREWMEDFSEQYIHCYACNKDIKNGIFYVKQHLNENKHMDERARIASILEELFSNIYSRMERNWYNARSYWCVPCRKNYIRENEFYAHLYPSKRNKHAKECQKFSQYTNFVFDFCPTCTTLFYGFRDTFAYHCQIEKHKFFSEKPFYVVSQLPIAVEKMLSKPESVIDEIVKSLDVEADKREEIEKLIIEDLETIVNNFTVSKAYAFGSRVSGLASDSSDLDIFLDCGDRYYDGKKTDDILSFLMEVESSLKWCTDIWSVNKTVKDCSVPIIKVTHKISGIECDISFMNGLTIECTQLIKTINQRFPLCRKLILFIKQWVNDCNLGGEKGICNYAITWMVIYYLQTKSLLPTIAKLIKLCGESKIIGGWEIGVNREFDFPEFSHTFKDLLKGFFKMYAEFNYRNNIICPLLGEPVQKTCFNDSKQLLPGEMETYKRYCSQKNYEPFRIDSPLCVQDPFDLSHNITKAVKKFNVSKFKTLCTLAATKLDKNSISDLIKY